MVMSMSVSVMVLVDGDHDRWWQSSMMDCELICYDYFPFVKHVLIVTDMYFSVVCQTYIIPFKLLPTYKLSRNTLVPYMAVLLPGLAMETTSYIQLWWDFLSLGWIFVLLHQRFLFHSFIHPCMYLLFYSFICLFNHSFTHGFVYSFISVIHLFVH